MATNNDAVPPSLAEFTAAMGAYRARFDAGPPLFGLDEADLPRLVPAMRRAVEQGRELTMQDIREALGLKPLPPGAVI
jgi:hypothetical protein